MAYVSEHEGALDAVREAGVAVTFTAPNRTHDAATDTFTATNATVVGSAVRVRGNPEEYNRLGLTPNKAVTLLFCPTTKGEQPSLDSTVTWGGVKHATRNVAPVAPDGSTILARVIVVAS